MLSAEEALIRFIGNRDEFVESGINADEWDDWSKFYEHVSDHSFAHIGEYVCAAYFAATGEDEPDEKELVNVLRDMNKMTMPIGLPDTIETRISVYFAYKNISDRLLSGWLK